MRKRQIYILQLWDFLSLHPFYLRRQFLAETRENATEAAKIYARIELSKHLVPLRFDWARGFCFIYPLDRQRHQNAFLYLTTKVEYLRNQQVSEKKETLQGKYIAQHVKRLEALGNLSETEIEAILASQYEQWIIDEFQRVQEGQRSNNLDLLMRRDDLPEV